MQVRLLGPVDVAVDGASRPVRGLRRKAVLAVLALHGGGIVSTGRLVDVVWGEAAPSTAVNTLQSHVSHLRQILGSRDAIRVRPPGYVLNLDDEATDVQAAERLIRQGTQSPDHSDRARQIRAALGLWRGRPLVDVAGVAWLDEQAERLDQLQLQARRALIDARLALGEHAQLLPDLEQLTRDHPFDEQIHGQLMLALYRTGRQADALAAFKRLRRTLADDLGIDPSQALRDIEAAILRQHPALDLAPPAVTRARSQEPARSPVPRQLPAPPQSFTGRARELAQLDAVAATADKAPTVVISAMSGIAGVGKSALAVYAANRLAKHFPDGQLYVNLQGAAAGMAPLDPLEVLGRFLRALGVSGDQVPAEVDEAAARFRSELADRRLLVVLDNAHDIDQVLPLLPGQSGCAALITSRRVLAGLDVASHLHLGVLEADEAIKLLGRLAGQDRVALEPEATLEVARRCGWLPLALRIAGARLAARPGWPVRALAERLADATHRLEELQASGLAVRASFEVSLHALQHSADPVDHSAARAFGLLGLPDGPDLSLTAAARLLDEPEPATDRLLERLVDAQLLETPSPGRYQFHDLMRLYAHQQATRQYPASARMAALTRLFGFLTATAWQSLRLLRPGDRRLATADPRWAQGELRFVDAAAALSWLEAERVNLMAAIGQAAAAAPAIPADVVYQLTRALFGFFDVRSYWHDELRADETALRLARAAGDRAAQAQACIDLGSLHYQTGRYQEGIVLLREGLVLARELGDRFGEAASLSNLGSIHERLGNYQEALTWQQDSLTLRRELGDRFGEAASLNNFGVVHERLGNYREAIACQQDSLTICRELGDRHGQAEALRDLGDALLGAGRPQQAREAWQEALELCEALQLPQAEELRALLNNLRPRV